MIEFCCLHPQTRNFNLQLDTWTPHRPRIVVECLQEPDVQCTNFTLAGSLTLIVHIWDLLGQHMREASLSFYLQHL